MLFAAIVRPVALSTLEIVLQPMGPAVVTKPTTSAAVIPVVLVTVMEVAESALAAPRVVARLFTLALSSVLAGPTRYLTWFAMGKITSLWRVQILRPGNLSLVPCHCLARKLRATRAVARSAAVGLAPAARTPMSSRAAFMTTLAVAL